MIGGNWRWFTRTLCPYAAAGLLGTSGALATHWLAVFIWPVPL